METPSDTNQAVTPDVEEEEIKKGLMGTADADHEEAFEKAYARFAKPLAAFIRENVAPTLDGDEVATAVSETFCGLAKYVERGKFRPNGAISTILFSIARCKAIDLLRSKMCIKRRDPNKESAADCDSEEGDQSDENFAVCVSQHLVKAPEIKAMWKTAADIGKANEIIRQFRLWIGTLPHLQRKVAEAILAHFGNISNEEFGAVSNKEICDYMARNGEHRPSEPSVRSARKEITRKFKALIQTQERNKQS